jgi:hypothetical protein
MEIRCFIYTSKTESQTREKPYNLKLCVNLLTFSEKILIWLHLINATWSWNETCLHDLFAHNV